MHGDAPRRDVAMELTPHSVPSEHLNVGRLRRENEEMWSYPPSRILVPVDFGKASGRAASVAGAIARRFRARVRALHAETLEAPPYFTHDQMGSLERQRIAARTAALRYLASFADAFTGVQVSAEIVDGPPESAIIEAARDTDLIVMGTHGRRGPSRWWLGSVAERVVRASNVPVLVVREEAEGAASSPEQIFARPLVVLGSDVFDGDANRYATGLASEFDGKVPSEAPACDVTVANERKATLMVIPAKTGGGNWFGESTERLLRGCTLPMLFVPSSPTSP